MSTVSKQSGKTEEVKENGKRTFRSKAKDLFVRVMNKLNFDVDFSRRKKRDWSPGHILASVKNASANSLTVFNSKQMMFDKPLFILVIVLVLVGTAMMSSASYAYAYSQYKNSMYFIEKQVVFVLLGIFLMLVVSTIPPDKFKGVTSYVFWFISLGLLVLVRLLPAKKGVHRWIDLGFTTFQPSELAKFAVILVCATYITYHFKEMNITTYKKRETKLKAARSNSYRIRYDLRRNFQTAVWPFIWRIGPVLGLLLLEPHLSCTIIIMLITGTLMLLGGTRKVFFGGLLALSGILVSLVVFTGFIPYGKTRIAVWMDPFADAKGAGWQNVQSLLAISSGGLFGAGFGNSRQKFMYIAEPQNDFIFAVVCEELGLVGAAFIIVLFAIFIWRGFAVSIANPDRFQKFVGIGITSQIGYQMILNIMVVTNMVPNTGISLPFFSSGGTSLTMLLAEIGVLLAISRSSPNKIT